MVEDVRAVDVAVQRRWIPDVHWKTLALGGTYLQKTCAVLNLRTIKLASSCVQVEEESRVVALAVGGVDGCCDSKNS